MDALLFPAPDPSVVPSVDEARQVLGRVIVLALRLTAPLRAKTRPSTVALLLTPTDVKAMSVPTNVEELPSVAVLPTCQKILHAWAPFTSCTTLADAVTRSDVA